MSAVVRLAVELSTVLDKDGEFARDVSSSSNALLEPVTLFWNCCDVVELVTNVDSGLDELKIPSAVYDVGGLV